MASSPSRRKKLSFRRSCRLACRQRAATSVGSHRPSSTWLATRSSLHPEGEVAIEVAARNDSLTFSVRDTGPGVAAADQAKIFEEFRQRDSSITKTKMGSGLGLAIAKRIVEMHGGRIWVDFSPGAGDILVHGPGARRTTGRATMKKTILVVEDQEDNRQILRDLLASAGFRMVERACTGEKC